MILGAFSNLVQRFDPPVAFVDFAGQSKHKPLAFSMRYRELKTVTVTVIVVLDWIDDKTAARDGASFFKIHSCKTRSAEAQFVGVLVLVEVVVPVTHLGWRHRHETSLSCVLVQVGEASMSHVSYL